MINATNVLLRVIVIPLTVLLHAQQGVIYVQSSRLARVCRVGLNRLLNRRAIIARLSGCYADDTFECFAESGFRFVPAFQRDIQHVCMAVGKPTMCIHAVPWQTR